MTDGQTIFIEEDLEKAAQNHAKKMYGENYMDCEYTQDAAFRAMSNFKFGAWWQKEQTIAKACEWLGQNAAVDINAFREAMEK